MVILLPYKKQLSTKKRFYTELRWAKWIFATLCLPPTSLGMADRLGRVDGEGSVSRAELLENCRIIAGTTRSRPCARCTGMTPPKPSRAPRSVDIAQLRIAKPPAARPRLRSQLSMPPRQLRRLRSGRLPIAETQLGALLPPLDAVSRSLRSPACLRLRTPTNRMAAAASGHRCQPCAPGFGVRGSVLSHGGRSFRCWSARTIDPSCR
jgi:hypothetical protein